MNYGYTGRILHVDLTNRDIDIEDRDEAFFRATWAAGEWVTTT